MTRRSLSALTGLVLLAAAPAFAQGADQPNHAGLMLSSRALSSYVTFDASPVDRSSPTAAAVQGLREIIMTSVFSGSLHWIEGYAVFDASVLFDYNAFDEGWNPDRTPLGSATFPARQAAAESWRPSIIGGFSFYSGNGAQFIDLTGGLRMSRRQSDTLRLYVQGAAGLSTGEGASGFVLTPGVGVILTSADRPYQIVAGFDFRIATYDGFTEKGPGFYGGVMIPIMTR
jgi:hypothetical protein